MSCFVCSLCVGRCFKRDCEGNSWRSMVEEEGARDKSSCGGKDRWSSYMDDEIGEAFSDKDGSYSPGFGDERRNWLG